MATLRFRLSSTLANPRDTCPPHQPYSWSHLVKRHKLLLVTTSVGHEHPFSTLDLKYDALRCELKWPARSIEGPLGQPLDESASRHRHQAASANRMLFDSRNRSASMNVSEPSLPPPRGRWPVVGYDLMCSVLFLT